MKAGLRVAVDVGGEFHQVALADPQGRLVELFRIPHTQAGFEHLGERVEAWKRRCGVEEVEVVMEGYNGLARPLDRWIQRRGYRLYNLNALKLARFRQVFSGGAKTDRLDVRRMLELWTLQKQLPKGSKVLERVRRPSRVEERLKVLSRRRRQLVEEKVRLVNRLRADLRAVCPELVTLTKDLSAPWFLRFLTARPDGRQLKSLSPQELLAIPGLGPKKVAKIQAWQQQAVFSEETELWMPWIQADARRLLELRQLIRQLEKQLEAWSQQSELASRLRTIPGFGRCTAAELAGELGTLERFPTEASLALYVGMCPLTHQSGARSWARCPRQVNRRAKAALMTAVARHIERVPESRSYYCRKRREGKRHNQAVRAVGRQLVRVIWALMREGRGYETRSRTHG